MVPVPWAGRVVACRHPVRLVILALGLCACRFDSAGYEPGLPDGPAPVTPDAPPGTPDASERIDASGPGVSDAAAPGTPDATIVDAAPTCPPDPVAPGGSCPGVCDSCDG